MSADFDISGYTLFERQSRFYNASQCVYCLGYTDLVDSIEVYQQSYGLIYICRTCAAWCGVHAGSDQSLGTVSQKPLRDLRHQAHLIFDPICEAKRLKDNVSKRKSKAAGYKWLSQLLDIEIETSHIGYFNIAQCKKVIEACKSFYPTPETITARAEALKFKKDIVYFISGEMNTYDVKEFEMNGLLQMELKHKISENKVFIFKPKENLGCWSGKRKKVIKINDLEKFIYENFK